MEYDIKFVPGVSMKQVNSFYNDQLYRGVWSRLMDREWMGIIDDNTFITVSSRLFRHNKYGKIEHATIQVSNKYKFNTTNVTKEFLQYVKDTLFGEKRFAIQVYPKIVNLVDQENIYHLFIFDKNIKDPFVVTKDFTIRHEKPDILIKYGKITICDIDYNVRVIEYDKLEEDTHLWNYKYDLLQKLYGYNYFAIEDFPFMKLANKRSKTLERLFVFDEEIDMSFGIHPSEVQLTTPINRGIHQLNHNQLLELEAMYQKMDI